MCHFRNRNWFPTAEPIPRRSRPPSHRNDACCHARFFRVGPSVSIPKSDLLPPRPELVLREIRSALGLEMLEMTDKVGKHPSIRLLVATRFTYTLRLRYFFWKLYFSMTFRFPHKPRQQDNRSANILKPSRRSQFIYNCYECAGTFNRLSRPIGAR